jgi:hypothetical protein
MLTHLSFVPCNQDLLDVRKVLMADAAAAVVALIVATALAVYKPRGMTALGQRSQTAG